MPKVRKSAIRKNLISDLTDQWVYLPMQAWG
jgi:hypothetical protein